MKDNSNSVVLILGAQGNLGSQIVQELADSNFGKVIAWTRIDCDLTNLESVKDKVKKLGPSIVINTVAYNNVDGCEEDIKERQKAIRLNVELVECLADICQKIDSKLIHFSTNYVFSGENERYTEMDTTSPINVYGLTKKMGEEAILAHISAGLDACIIRVSNLFGPAGTGSSSKPGFFEIISKMSKSKDFLNIIDDEKNCFTYTKDIARELISALGTNDFSGIYHFVNSQPVTWYEAAQVYFELSSQSVKLNPVAGKSFERSAKRPKSAILESTRRMPMRSFRLAMAEYLEG